LRADGHLESMPAGDPGQIARKVPPGPQKSNSAFSQKLAAIGGTAAMTAFTNFYTKLCRP
jgi:hypothetical protein